jgi:hypothetical protein
MKPKNKMHPKMVRKLADYRKRKGKRKLRVQRVVRPDPRTFTNFPADSKCPICGTNDDGKTVLVEIAGTAKDGIAEAKPMHLACAVAKQWDEGMGIALTWPNV